MILFKLVEKCLAPTVVFVHIVPTSSLLVNDAKIYRSGEDDVQRGPIQTCTWSWQFDIPPDGLMPLPKKG